MCLYYLDLFKGPLSCTAHACVPACVWCHLLSRTVQWLVRFLLSQWSLGLLLCAKGSLPASDAKWRAVHSQSNWSGREATTKHCQVRSHNVGILHHHLGSFPEFYFFLLDNAKIGPDGSVLTLANTQPESQGPYRCVGVNAAGRGTATATLNVKRELVFIIWFSPQLCCSCSLAQSD